MDRDERAEPGVHRMPEAQHAALPEQHVVAQADDDEVAHLRQHASAPGCSGTAAAPAISTTAKSQPDRVARDQACAAARHVDPAAASSSVLPRCRAGPWAGRSGSAPGTGTAGSARSATIVRLSSSPAEGLRRHVNAERRQRAASDWSIATAKVWITPISSDARKAPASEPMPPTTTTTKMIEPTAAAIAGSVT